MTWQSKKQLREELAEVRLERDLAKTDLAMERAKGRNVSVATKGTRRETLEKVIEALELKDYGGHTFGGLLAPPPDADRFWADINTALEVRAGRKAQERREATEKKVAGLAKRGEPARFFVFNHGESYGAAQTISEGDIQVAPRQSGKSTAASAKPKKSAKPAKKESK